MRRTLTGKCDLYLQCKAAVSISYSLESINGKLRFCDGLVIVLISLLLFQFGTDVENVVNLVSLPQYFDLEEYGQRRLGKVCEYFNAVFVSFLLASIHCLSADDCVNCWCLKSLYGVLTQLLYSREIGNTMGRIPPYTVRQAIANRSYPSEGNAAVGN